MAGKNVCFQRWGRMRILCTGYVNLDAGSVASANLILLRGLLARGHTVHFFSKPEFVDPRPWLGKEPGFSFTAVRNQVTSLLFRMMPNAGLLSRLFGMLDAAGYNRALVAAMVNESQRGSWDLVLWLGEYARGKCGALPVVSFAQGPPGTDARSIYDRRSEMIEACGAWRYALWKAAAAIRLSPWGLPPLRYSDAILVGSSISKKTLVQKYMCEDTQVYALPYPIDPAAFAALVRGESDTSTLRLLWLGRMVPRKRMKLFLEGLLLVIEQGVKVTATVVGQVSFPEGTERLLENFKYPQALHWVRSIPRDQVPTLLASVDVLVQPSDEENFGSSVAEAQMCGLPVVVGATNGNADYLSARDTRLADDRAGTLAAVFADYARRKSTGTMGDPEESRRQAISHFAPEKVAIEFEGVLQRIVSMPKGKAK